MRRLMMLCAVLFCAGCGAGKPESRPELAGESAPESPAQWAAGGGQTGAVRVGWIDAFGDGALAALVAEAQAENQDLRAAAADVEKSRALVQQAGAALAPSVALDIGGKESGAAEGGGVRAYAANLQVGWEADVWGRIRAGQSAAEYGAEAIRADYRYARHSLAAAVARAYFVAIEARRREELAVQIVGALSRIVRIAAAQYQDGGASKQDVALARSDLAVARENLAAAQGGKRDALRALESLLGRYPGADLEVRPDLPSPPPPPPAGMPSALLERRPDLIAAERRIAAAVAGVNQAKAARLPRIRLSGAFGGASADLSRLLNPANLAWQAAANLLHTVADGGAGEAAIAVAAAEQKAAVAAYARAALRAFAETEAALDQGVVIRRRIAALESAVAEIGEARRIARLRYDEGESDLLETLTIEQRLFTARGGLISARRELLEQFVILNLALGGDWRAPR